MLLQNTSGQFFRKTLKLFRSDLERTSKDTTLNPKTNQLMNKKFLPGAVLFIITFVLSSLAFPTHVKAQVNTFYGQGAGIRYNHRRI